MPPKMLRRKEVASSGASNANMESKEWVFIEQELVNVHVDKSALQEVEENIISHTMKNSEGK